MRSLNTPHRSRCARQLPRGSFTFIGQLALFQAATRSACRVDKPKPACLILVHVPAYQLACSPNRCSRSCSTCRRTRSSGFNHIPPPCRRAYITVVWSLPPNSSPIFGNDTPPSSRIRYMATLTGRRHVLWSGLLLKIRSLEIQELGDRADDISGHERAALR